MALCAYMYMYLSVCHCSMSSPCVVWAVGWFIRSSLCGLSSGCESQGSYILGPKECHCLPAWCRPVYQVLGLWFIRWLRVPSILSAWTLQVSSSPCVVWAGLSGPRFVTCPANSVLYAEAGDCCQGSYLLGLYN